MGVTLCGDDSDEGELFYISLSRNEAEYMKDITKSACSKICVTAAQESSYYRSIVVAVKIIKAYMLAEA
jgi:hypothetical protein